MTKQELVKFLLDNFTNQYGNLDLSNLDFSDFNGYVDISNMKVKGILFQDHQTVNGGFLYQDCQKVEGDLLQNCQTVGGWLYQNCQKVEGNLWQDRQKVGGDLWQLDQQVNGTLFQDVITKKEKR